MQPTSSSQLLPLTALSPKARALIEMIYARQWQLKYKPQVHLVHELTAGSIAEHALKMDQYRLSADDYQRAAQDPIILQAWLGNLPPHIRDVQVT